MCGIVGYIGKRRVVPILLEGLKRLEYRGYDSAGLVYLEDGRLKKHRCQGKLGGLQEMMEEFDIHSRIGLGHTRWATHGAPSELNAHPHSDCSGELVVVHNGIIENHQTLRDELVAAGHRIESDTDTEVLAHLIEDALEDDLARAVRTALKRVEGSYAVGVLWSRQPDRLIAVRNHSPLVLGIQEGGSFMASDIPALLPYTRQVVFLADREMAVLTAGTWQIMNLEDAVPLDREVHNIDWNAAMAEKTGYRHFMLKEIFEQPQAILNTYRGRINPETGRVDLSESGLTADFIETINRIVLVACGTSWHAALVAKYWLEELTGINTEVDIASEFRYRRLLLNQHTLVIPISQSGETADTLAGMRLAGELSAKILGICNVVGSTMTRESHGTIYTHAGPEIGVASTKAFTSQLTALFLLTLYIAQSRGSITDRDSKDLAEALLALPGIIETELPRLQDETGPLAETLFKNNHFLYLGRGLNYPIALEGALKLKEISYIHAEGYPAGELKHGPIALIDQDLPVLGLVPRDHVYEKVISNIEEVKARHGRILLVGSRNDQHLAKISNEIITLPETHPRLNPILYSIPLQLLAYQIANRRGCDVDQPRNLAKSVTVE